jgi:hypothetical protein
VYAKGFGNVQGYFMKTSDLLPPKELLVALGVEPSLGRFHFDVDHSSDKGDKYKAANAATLQRVAETGSESDKACVLMDADDEEENRH